MWTTCTTGTCTTRTTATTTSTSSPSVPPTPPPAPRSSASASTRTAGTSRCRTATTSTTSSMAGCTTRTATTVTTTGRSRWSEEGDLTPRPLSGAERGVGAASRAALLSLDPRSGSARRTYSPRRRGGRGVRSSQNTTGPPGSLVGTGRPVVWVDRINQRRAGALAGDLVVVRETLALALDALGGPDGVPRIGPLSMVHRVIRATQRNSIVHLPWNRSHLFRLPH